MVFVKQCEDWVTFKTVYCVFGWYQYLVDIVVGVKYGPGFSDCWFAKLAEEVDMVGWYAAGGAGHCGPDSLGDCVPGNLVGVLLWRCFGLNCGLRCYASVTLEM